MLKISSLFIFPIKAARGISVGEAVVEPLGLRHDRRFMIVDDRGEFVTQRDAPTLARLATQVDGNVLVLRGDDGHSLEVPLDCKGPLIPVRVWDDELQAHDCGPLAAGLVTTQAGRVARLVRLPDAPSRPIDPEYSGPNDYVSFADGFPLLVTTTATVDAALAASGTAIDAWGPWRFRANVVLEGAAPEEEESWRALTIGGVRIDLVKPCARCTVIDVDPRTGAKGQGVLKALTTTRRARGQKPILGMNGIPRLRPDAQTRIRVGDEVVVEHD